MDNWNLVQQQNPCDYLVFLMTYFQDHPQKSLSVVRGFIKKTLCLSLFFFDDVFWEKEFGEKEVGEKEVEVSLEVIVSTQSAWPLPPQRGQKKEKKRKKRKSWSVLRSYFIHTVCVALAPAEGTTLIEHVAPDKETFTTLLVEFSAIWFSSHCFLLSLIQDFGIFIWFFLTVSFCFDSGYAWPKTLLISWEESALIWCDAMGIGL